MDMENTDSQDKYIKLLQIIKPYGRAAIAFSGGVDSALLVHAAAEALGPENIICITARAASFPERETKEAEDFCISRGIRHKILDFDEFSVAGFSSNPPDRCYLCKRELLSQIIASAAESFSSNSVSKTSRTMNPIILEGSNADDGDDYRPGMKAVKELNVKSPLLDAGLSKADIRNISKKLNLPTWNKQSFACLASRFVYGEEITLKKLDMVSKAEQFLLERGFSTTRVRIHGKVHYIARIETNPEESPEILKEPFRSEIAGYLKELGFSYVTVDLFGYRSGSMNEVLS
jgi:uncharacterized protein